MDWFSWLSKTQLEPSLVYEYALSFVHNELEEGDIVYFNHEFLQSMGISIAKHRLEILKLARKEKVRRMPPVVWFILAIKQAKRCLAKQVNTLAHRGDAALAIVPKRNYSFKWRIAMLQRNKGLVEGKPLRPVLTKGHRCGSRVESGHKMLMLTNGSPMANSNSWSNSFYSPYALSYGEKMDDYDYEYLSSGVEEIKWDAMFQNMKPT